MDVHVLELQLCITVVFAERFALVMLLYVF